MTRRVSKSLSYPITLALIASAWFLSGANSALPSKADQAPNRFLHGVNLSHWFSQSFQGYGLTHLTSFVTDTDLITLKQAGLDHVRLSVDPRILFRSGLTQEPDSQVLDALVRALDHIQAAGLATVIDLHLEENEKAMLLTEVGQNNFVGEWRTLSRMLATRRQDTVAFEILNEPNPLKGDEWWSLQGRAIAVIRELDKDRTIIVNGGGWSGIDDLIAHEPYVDYHLVYTIHYYDPILFTHQGANWSWNIAERVAALKWPQSLEQADTSAGAATHDEEAEGFVRSQISNGEFTSKWMYQQFDKLVEWQKSHDLPQVYLGEFGVYAKAAPVEARLRWIAAVRRGCEERGWSWALWDNSVSFGFANARDGKQVIDPGMLLALGTKR